MPSWIEHPGRRAARRIARNILLSVPPVLLAAACGSRTDSGSGSDTLFALIEVTGKPESTGVEVELKLRGNPVVGANVVVTDDDTKGTTTLEGRSAGLYKATLTGYARTLGVKITSGEDTLEARLEGPSPHVITRPPNDAIVRRADFDVLRVEWQADTPADRVEIEPEGTDAITLDGDVFEALVPLGPLKSREQRIGVTRETSVDLAGGVEGSKMRSRYKVDNRFTLEG